MSCHHYQHPDYDYHGGYFAPVYRNECCEGAPPPPYNLSHGHSHASSPYNQYRPEYFHEDQSYGRYSHDHKKMEHLGELGAVAAAAYSLFEAHKAKACPDQDGEAHKQKGEMAGLAALASGAYAAYEHHQKKKTGQY